MEFCPFCGESLTERGDSHLCPSCDGDLTTYLESRDDDSGKDDNQTDQDTTPPERSE